MTGFKLTPTKLALTGFIVTLLLAWVCYQPALTGAIQLDDASNLSGLAAIEDAGGLADFVLSGASGPGGRPIALLTFALQADQWEQGAAAFLSVNIVIHLLNALLLFFALLQLCQLQSLTRERAFSLAAATASLWVIMPLLASASLLIVQRMTTLSAFFVLLGLAAYLYFRRRLDYEPKRALLGMSVSLALGTLLAALSKESGLLLPCYILALEATVIHRPKNVAKRTWNIWMGVFLLLPTAAIVAYLATRISYPDWVVQQRGFNAWERLATEARLLWLYLYKAVLSVPSQLGIYQTPPQISRTILEPLTLLAVVSWPLLLAAAIRLRRRLPLLSLSVLWYLAGHIIESTVVPLEVYFEHRNYLPIIGPLFAVVSFLLYRPVRHYRIAALLIPLYVLVSAYFLYVFASLSGEPSVASRYWAAKYPDSVRAVTTMATYQLTEEGPLRTLTTIDRFALEQPQHAYLRIQELNLRCRFMPAEDHQQVLTELRRDLPSVDFTYTAGTMLSQLFSTTISAQCNGVGFEQVAELASILRTNPRYAQGPLYNQFHHKLMAGIARQNNDLDDSIDHLKQAMSYLPSKELNMMMVTALGSAGDYNAANEFIDVALQRLPRNPLQASVWRSELQNLRDYIGELERYSQSVE